MIDLHCHLLPGIDDGPDTLQESLELCRMAVADGISHAIVTPHIHPGRWENTRQSIEQACSQLQQNIEQQGIALKLGFAAEVRLSDQIMQQVANKEIPFYGVVDGYQIMLLEFPHGYIIPGSDKLVAWLLQRNIRPLIAHPERNRQVMKDLDQLIPFLDAGCWLQLTAGSLLGDFGEAAQTAAQKLLQNNDVKVVASDAHNTRARPPVLSKAFKWIAEHYDAARAEQLMLHAPLAIVAA